MFTFRLGADLKRALEEVARRNERTPAAEVRFALRRHLGVAEGLSGRPRAPTDPRAGAREATPAEPA
jgi:TraY domain